MMALTHAAIAAAGVSFAVGEVSPLVMGLAVLGSQLPDLDTSSSLIGQVCFPVSRWLESRYPHRSLTHSLLATMAIALVSLPLFFYWGWKPWIALWLGHVIACFSDTFTKQGVQLFFPNPVWCVCGSNPNKRLRTGSPSEYWVLAVAIALLLVNIKLTSFGGIVQTASQQLGLKDGLLDAYNANAATHHVYAEVKGVKASDRSPVDGKFFILGTEGSEFILQGEDGIYKTGEQIISDRLTTTVGGEASTKVQTLTFDDEEAVEGLQQLRAAYPGAAIYLSGTVTVDYPEDVKLIPSPDLYQIVTLSGNSVQFEYCDIERALAVLNDQYIIGNLTAKIVSPKPD
jgi:inner membrane protein